MGASSNDDEAIKVEAIVRKAVEAATGQPLLSLDTSLLEAGVDSEAAPSIAAQLRELTGLKLSPMLAFEQPTPRAIAAHVLSLSSGKKSSDTRADDEAIKVEAIVRKAVEAATGQPLLSLDTSLLEAGVDSEAAPSIAAQLRELTGLKLSPMLAFEQPTPRAIAAHVLSLSSGKKSSDTRADDEAIKVEAIVRKAVEAATGQPLLSLDTSLLEAGVDSEAAPSIAAQLRELTGLKLSPMLAFEQPTPRAIAAHVLSLSSGKKSSDTRADDEAIKVEAIVLRAVQAATGQPLLSLDTSLLEAGLDSEAAPGLSAQLRELTGLKLSPMLAFEQPTPRAIAAHVLSLSSRAAASTAKKSSDTRADVRDFSLSFDAADGVSSVVQSGLSTLERILSKALEYDELLIDARGGMPPAAASRAARPRPVHLLGVASAWPGGVAGTCVSKLMHGGCVAANAVPARRWKTDEAAAGSGWARHGGFCQRMHRFDASFFAISHDEAAAMDPQQRLLLEVGYDALHLADQRRASLSASRVAVHVGIDHLDWQTKQQRHREAGTGGMSTFAGSGEHANMAAGRLAYVFNLRGPSMSLNSACSSSLVACHIGAQFMRSGECPNVLAAGAKALLLPFLLQDLYSPDGRCKTFDARANGYCRSEAVGALYMGADAWTVQVCGSAVFAGGKSANLTAPNGLAIGNAVKLALAQASAHPQELDATQVQGLGSALADPIEISALNGVMSAAPGSALAVGCHKPNVGHSEAASGMLGITMALHLLHEAVVSPNPQLRVANPWVARSMTEAVLLLPTNLLLRKAVTWSGVSAFGWSGTFAHILLKQRQAPRDIHRAHAERKPQPVYRRKVFGWVAETLPFTRKARLTDSAKADACLSSASAALKAARVLLDAAMEGGEAMKSLFTQSVLSSAKAGGLAIQSIMLRTCGLSSDELQGASDLLELASDIEKSGTLRCPVDSGKLALLSSADAFSRCPTCNPEEWSASRYGQAEAEAALSSATDLESWGRAQMSAGVALM